jgi:hypothetical protein
MRAGGLVEDINPDTMMLVSSTTRTLRSNRCDLCRNLFGGEWTDFLGGATQLTNHAPEALTTSLPLRRFQNHHVRPTSDRDRFAPTFHPG